VAESRAWLQALARTCLAALLVLPSADERPVARAVRAARVREKVLPKQQPWERAAVLPLLGRALRALLVQALACAPVRVQYDLA
jgi:hypothetical protein